MSWVNTRAAIKTVLDTLVPATLGVVLNGEQAQQGVEISAWPAAELVRIQTEEDYHTNREDMQTYVFAVNLYQEIHENDTAAVETSMDAVVDAVMDAFMTTANISLSGVATGRMRPVGNQSAILAWQGKTCRRDTVILKPRVVTSID